MKKTNSAYDLIKNGQLSSSPAPVGGFLKEKPLEDHESYSSAKKPIHSGILPMTGSKNETKMLFNHPKHEEETKNMIEGFFQNHKIYNPDGESDIP